MKKRFAKISNSQNSLDIVYDCAQTTVYGFVGWSKTTCNNRAVSNKPDMAVIFRFVYWTDTNSASGHGQVWRMRYDGSGKELVFDKLNNPHAITVDHASK